VNGLGPDAVAAAFRAACRAELQALKPGNVHIHADGHGMTVAQFERSAEAAAPFIAADAASVGERVSRAVEASLAAAGCNTNLGIVLLCAPLAAAAGLPGQAPLRTRLRGVLAALGPADAAAVFRAIALANPGGLGRAPEQDVAAAPTAGLVEAMALAAGRDRIARAYATGFAELFDTAGPALAAERALHGDMPRAVTGLHMRLLAAEPDSHVLRKHGAARAEALRARAAAILASDPDEASLRRFDSELKRDGLNPGTTADLVVATLFAAFLQRAGGAEPAGLSH
jgi:triphosphoribosyl-dephospho-CoA synthase